MLQFTGLQRVRKDLVTTTTGLIDSKYTSEEKKLRIHVDVDPSFPLQSISGIYFL